MNRREKVVVSVGAVAVVAILGYRLVQGGAGAGAGAGETGSIGASLANIRTHDQLERSVQKLTAELKLEIPEVDSAEQITLIRKDLSSQAQKNGLQVTSVRRQESRGRRRGGAVRPAEFRLEVTGRFDSVMGFVHSLETAKIPYVVADVKIDPASAAQAQAGRPGGNPPSGGSANQARASRGARRSTGSVRALLTVKSYVFPEVATAAGAASMPDQSGESTRSGDEMTTGTLGDEAPTTATTELSTAGRANQVFSGDGVTSGAISEAAASSPKEQDDEE